MFAALVMSPKDIAIIVLAVIAVAAIVGFLFRKDTEQEGRLKGYGELGHWFAEIKMPSVAEIFTCLSVKDFSGTAKAIGHLVKMLLSTKQRLVLLDENFYYQLAERCTNETDWPKIQKLVQAKSDSLRADAGRALAALKRSTPEEIATAPVASPPVA